MLSPTKKLEIVRITVLNSLAAPENLRDGMTVVELNSKLHHNAKATHGVRGRRENYTESYFRQHVLASMVDEGLISKDESNPRSKPYRITEEGRKYLDESLTKALSTTPGQRQDWSNSASGPTLPDEIAVALRSLPEFRNSDEERIREVSEHLAGIMARTTPNDRER